MGDPEDVTSFDRIILKREERLANARDILLSRKSQLANLQAQIAINERQVFLLEQDLGSLRKMREDAAG